MFHRRHIAAWLAAMSMVLGAVPSFAQLSPSIVAQGQVLSNMNRGYAERGRSRARPAVTRQQAAACANKGRFRAQYGADNLKVRQLYRLCRDVGL